MSTQICGKGWAVYTEERISLDVHGYITEFVYSTYEPVINKYKGWASRFRGQPAPRGSLMRLLPTLDWGEDTY